MGRSVIYYNRRRWSSTQRASALAAMAAAALLPWWLSSPASPAATGGASAAAPRARALADARGVREVRDSVRRETMGPLHPLPLPPPGRDAGEPAAAPEAAPYHYVGHWTQGARTTVVLSVQGFSLLVPVPGRIDQRYDLESIDERHVVLRDRGLGRDLALPLWNEAARPSHADAAAVQRRGIAPATTPASRSMPEGQAVARRLPPPANMPAAEPVTEYSTEN